MSEMRTDIVVGVDDSEASVAAVIWAIREARIRGSRVHALHAWRHEPLAEFAFTEPEEAARESTALLDRQIAKARAREGDDVEVLPRVVPGTPAAALLGAVADGELLVVGSHRGGFLREMLLGSCSAACVRHAHTPVVVIPPPERGPQTEPNTM
ncbi:MULTISPECIES: universal stress protein [Actinoalloteichus]|uniref:Universal stress protein UspA-like protein n=1 Tax=Actinoalloteichus fjordicus TaxID=1612552 RepID=A0AAC9PRU9_9PSEU|nr:MULTISPECIES: universal stress protein [Actinoalloteichus]APU14166.1 universal stress protein UspA-like protein [Actinoalloteichus fjordicus]APU20112.1 universal stress protein UspA-like protein [Actinoalloteichus sp. GBA129-24]